MKYIKKFKLNESKEVNIEDMKREFFKIISSKFFTEDAISSYEEMDDDNWNYMGEYDDYRSDAYLIKYKDIEALNIYYVIKVEENILSDDLYFFYIYDEEKKTFISEHEYPNEEIVDEINDENVLRALEETEEVISHISIEDYMKSLKDTKKAIVKLNEAAEQRPHGGGVTLDPKDAKKAHISIDGIYFQGEGYRNIEHKNIFNEECIKLCNKLSLDFEIDRWGTVNVDTDDVKIYFHPERTVIEVRSDKVELGEIAPWVANEISEFDLPITVSYFYT